MENSVLRPENRYEFAIKGNGPFFLLTDAELILSDEGVSYALKGRSGLRPFSGLRGIRLQLLSPRPSWVAVIELQFMRGEPLFVYSKLQTGPVRERSQAFAAFVRDLHRRLSADDKKRIVFRRGISPARHRFVIGCTVIFAAPLLFLIGAVLVGKVSLTEVLFPMIGCGVFVAGFCNLIMMTRPGTYEPDDLPNDLLNS
ncbi:hypothetical protein PMI07_005968 [Rhizobium sp. CF080]|uniref:hypothetical protein n=1 Tax=Rhizobium sp. (strain CF080) TaxID=1144310 RepID=UPI0002715E30|nr:hypothetical protein [Rhizobium sp. CF080]EUB99687.1 hypothetical protein PMI07_005968 [Rhizobium sp. CF080]